MSENGPKIVRKCVEKCQKGPKMPDNLSEIKSPMGLKMSEIGSKNVRKLVQKCQKMVRQNRKIHPKYHFYDLFSKMTI